MTIRSPAKLGALSHRSLPRPQSPQIGPECGSNPGRACQTRAQDDGVHVAAPACGYSANSLNISSREDRCFFLRCYRNPGQVFHTCRKDTNQRMRVTAAAQFLSTRPNTETRLAGRAHAVP